VKSESDGNDIDTYNYEIMHCLMTAAKKCSRVTTTTTTTILHPFNILFTGNLDKLAPQMETIWILLKQEMIGWQWYQLDHMQIIYTLHQTDNDASTSPLSFYRPDAIPATKPTASKH